MIDWYDLAANTLWILSLSLILAIISLARWEARSSGKKLIELLNRAVWQTSLTIAGVMFCCGMAFTSDKVWKQVLWAILMGLFLVQMMITWLLSRRED